MLPQNHFLVAVVVTLVAVVLFYPDLDWVDALVWILVAGIVAAIIDLDVMIYVRMKAKDDPELRPWVNPAAVSKDLKTFLVLLSRKGLLSTIKYTHVASAVFASLIGYFALPSLFIPIVIGAWSHLMTDIPYLNEIRKAAAAPQ
jgi:hypothetical protein